MVNCPVLIELVDQKLKDHYQGNYLLQVWNKRGENVYQKVLKHKLHCWNIFYDYLLFTLNAEEEDSQFIHVIFLHLKGATLKLKDFVKDPSYIHLAIKKDKIYFANESCIKMVDFTVTLSDGQVEELEIPKD